MPFKSKAQRRWMHANKPEMADEWEEHISDDAKLPERAKKKDKAKVQKENFDVRLRRVLDQLRCNRNIG